MEAGPRGPLGGLQRLVREHPGLVASGAYVAATGTGMLSSWTLYDEFGVNIFHYAQLSDFVVAAVRSPSASLAILLAIPAVWVIIRLDDYLARRYSWVKYLYGPTWLRKLSRTSGAYVLYLVLYAYAFSLFSTGRAADRIRRGEGPAVTVQLQSGTVGGRDATIPFSTQLLGTTSAYVLLYERSERTVTVVPVENVASLTVERSGGSD